MPDDTTDLDVALTKNDGTDQFDLKVQKWDRQIGNNVVIKGILSAAGDELGGKDVNLGFEKYTFDGTIADTQSGTYPEGGNYPSVDESVWAKSTEKEMALAHATRTWGPDATDGFDTVDIGPRTLGVMISKLNATENRSKMGPEQYTFTLELTHADLYVGND